MNFKITVYILGQTIPHFIICRNTQLPTVEKRVETMLSKGFRQGHISINGTGLIIYYPAHRIDRIDVEPEKL